MEEDYKKLYDSVSSKFDVGSFEDFNTKMKTPEDRKKFYDAVGEKGFDLGDYESFETRLKKKDLATDGGKALEESLLQDTEPSATQVEPVTPSPTQQVDESLLEERVDKPKKFEITLPEDQYALPSEQRGETVLEGQEKVGQAEEYQAEFKKRGVRQFEKDVAETPLTREDETVSQSTEIDESNKVIDFTVNSLKESQERLRQPGYLESLSEEDRRKELIKVQLQEEAVAENSKKIALARKESGDKYLGMTQDQKTKAVRRDKVFEQYDREQVEILNELGYDKKKGLPELTLKEKEAVGGILNDFKKSLEGVRDKDYDKYMANLGKSKKELLKEYLNESIYPQLRSDVKSFGGTALWGLIDLGSGKFSDIKGLEVKGKDPNIGVEEVGDSMKGALALMLAVQYDQDPTAYMDKTEYKDWFGEDSDFFGNIGTTAEVAGGLAEGVIGGALALGQLGSGSDKTLEGYHVDRMVDDVTGISQNYEKALNEIGVEVPENVKDMSKSTRSEKWREGLSLTGQLIPEFAFTELLTAGGASAIQGAKVTKKFTDLYSKMNKLNKITNNKTTKILTGTILKGIDVTKQGLKYEAVGHLFKDAEDEANFGSGVAGALGQSLAVLPGFSKLKSPQAQKLLRFFGAGVGETFEETAQSLFQIYDAGGDFGDVKEQFTGDNLVDFLGMTMVMGMAMGGSSVLSDQKKGAEILDYVNKEKAKLTPEQLGKFNKATGYEEMSKVVDESVGKSMPLRTSHPEETGMIKGGEVVEEIKPADTVTKEVTTEEEVVVPKTETVDKKEVEPVAQEVTEEKTKVNLKGEVDEIAHKEMPTSTDLDENKTQQTEVAGLTQQFEDLTTREKKGSKGAELINDIKTKAQDYGFDVSIGPENSSIRVTKGETKIQSFQSETDVTRDENYKSPKQRNFNDQSNRLLDVFMDDTSIMKGTGDNFSDSELNGIVNDLKSGKPTRRATRLLDRIQEFGESGTHKMLTDSKAEKGVWSGGPLEDILSDYEKGIDIELKKQVEQELLESKQGGGKERISELETELKELKVKKTTPSLVKTEKTVVKSKPSQETKKVSDSSSSEKRKSVFVNAINRSTIPQESKDVLINNLKRGVITVSETKKVAKQYIEDFEGAPMEAFEALSDVSSDLVRMAVGVEAVNVLKEQAKVSKGDPTRLSEYNQASADIIDLLDQIDVSARDKGRAINYLKELYDLSSAETLNIVIQKKVERLNEKAKEKQGASDLTNSDIDEVTKQVLESDEIKKLQAQVEALKSKVSTLESTSEVVRKERAKIKTHKKNISSIRDKYKNSPNPLSVSVIPGVTAKDMQYAIDLSKEYIGMGVSEVKILAQKLKEEFNAVGVNLDPADLETIAKEQIAENQDKEVLKEAKKQAIADETSVNSMFEDFVLGKDKGKLMDTLVNTLGLSEKDAKKLTTKIENTVNKTLKKSLTSKIEDKLLNSNISRKGKVAKTIADNIVLGHKTGSLLSEEAKKIYGEQFGVIDMDNAEFQKGLSEQVDKVSNQKPGSAKRAKAEHAMMEWLNYHRKMDYKDLLRSMYFANILSGYNTHLNNISYGVNTVLKEVVKNAVVGLMKPEFRASNKAIFKALGVAMDVSKDVFISGVEGDVKYEVGGKKGSFERTNELKRSKFGLMNGVLKALMAEDEYFTTLVKESKLTKILYDEAVAKKVKESTDGKVSRSERKDIVKKINDTKFGEKEVEIVNTQAIKEITKESGLDSDAMVKNKKGKYVLNPDHENLPKKQQKEIVRDFNIRHYEITEQKMDMEGEATKSAYEFAKQEILSGAPTGTAGILYSWVNTVLGSSPMAQLLVMPFVKVPLNSAKRIVDYTPIFGTIWHSAKLLGKYTSSQKQISESTLGLIVTDEAISRMGLDSNLTETRKRKIVQSQIVSTVAVATLYGLIKSFEDDEEEMNPVFDITGDLGGEWKRSEVLKQGEQKRPYTIYVNGEPIATYLYTPYVGIFAMLGSVRDIERKDSKDDYETLFGKLAMSSFKNYNVVIDQSAMTGVNRMMTTVTRIIENASKGEGDKAGDLALKELAKTVQNFIPAVGAIKQANDDIKYIMGMPKKEVVNTMDYLYRNIPIADNYLEDKTDYFGKPLKRDLDLSILRTYGVPDKDYAILEKYDVDISKKIDYSAKTLKSYNGVTISLTKDQLQELRGYIKEYRGEMIDLYDMDKEYSDYEDEVEARSEFKKEFNKIHNRATAEGKVKFIENNESLFEE